MDQGLIDQLLSLKLDNRVHDTSENYASSEANIESLHPSEQVLPDLKSI